MSFHMPNAPEVLALLVVAFLAGFAWTAGAAVCSWLIVKARARRTP